MCLSRYFAALVLIAAPSVLFFGCSPDPGGDSNGDGESDTCVGTECEEQDAGADTTDDTSGPSDTGVRDSEAEDSGVTDTGDATDTSGGSDGGGEDALAGECSTEPIDEFGRTTCQLPRCWEKSVCVEMHLADFIEGEPDLSEGDLDNYERCGDPIEVDSSTARTECEKEIPRNALNVNPADGNRCDIMDVTFQVRFWCPPAPAGGELDSLLAAVRTDTTKPAPEVLERTDTSYRWRTWDKDIEPLRTWMRDGNSYASEEYGTLSSDEQTYGGSTTEGETTPAGALEYYLIRDIDNNTDVSIGGRLLFEHRESWGDYSDPNNPQSDSERLGWYWVAGYTTGSVDITALRSE